MTDEQQLNEQVTKNSGNATEAPTSGVTVAALAKATGAGTLTKQQQQFVTLQCQYFAVHGILMDVGVATEQYYFEPDEYLKLIKNKQVLAALAERGAIARGQSTKYSDHEVGPNESSAVDTFGAVEPNDRWTDSVLEPLQLIVANAMLDLVDTRSQKKKLQDLGVSTQKYNMWLKDPVFQGYLKDRSEAMLGENQHEAHLALLDKVRMGDMKAITYYNEMTGRFKTETSNGTGTNVQLDFKNLLIRVLEVINDEVDGPVALRIGERLRGLIGATSTAAALIQASAGLAEEDLIEPEIAQTRQLSPRLQKLMDEGEGYE